MAENKNVDNGKKGGPVWDGPSQEKPYLRIRNWASLSLAAFSVAFTIYRYESDHTSTEETTRKAEHAAITAQCRQYTNDKTSSIEQNFSFFRDHSKEINERQDDSIRYLRKVWTQAIK